MNNIEKIFGSEDQNEKKEFCYQIKIYPISKTFFFSKKADFYINLYIYYFYVPSYFIFI